MNRRGIGAAVVLAAGAACAAPSPSAEVPESGPGDSSPYAAAPEFISDYGYQVSLDTNLWLGGPNEGTWDQERIPYPDDPGIDSFYSSDAGAWFFAAAREPEPGETASAAAASLSEMRTRQFGFCKAPTAEPPMSVGGTDAVIQGTECTGHAYVFDAIVLADDRVFIFGYHVFDETNVAESRTVFHDLLEGVTFGAP